MFCVLSFCFLTKLDTIMYVFKSIYFSLQILPALCVLIHHTDVNVSIFYVYNMYVYGYPYDLGKKMLYWT